MAPECSQFWISVGGGEGGSVVGRRMSPNLAAGSGSCKKAAAWGCVGSGSSYEKFAA